MLGFLGVVSWGSIRSCIIFCLFGEVVGSPGVVTGRYKRFLCSKTAVSRIGIRHTQETSVQQWSTQPATI
jgi:hypothetical protein